MKISFVLFLFTFISATSCFGAFSPKEEDPDLINPSIISASFTKPEADQSAEDKSQDSDDESLSSDGKTTPRTPSASASRTPSHDEGTSLTFNDFHIVRSHPIFQSASEGDLISQDKVAQNCARGLMPYTLKDLEGFLEWKDLEESLITSFGYIQVLEKHFLNSYKTHLPSLPTVISKWEKQKQTSSLVLLNLGLAYLWGIGVDPSPVKAESYLRASIENASKQGIGQNNDLTYSEACYWLGDLLRNISSGSVYSYPEAQERIGEGNQFTLEAARYEHPFALQKLKEEQRYFPPNFNLNTPRQGDTPLIGRRGALPEVIDDTDPSTQFRLGESLMKSDINTAMYWFIKASQQGNADAHYALAMIYFFGIQGIESDLKLYRQYIRQAEDQNHPAALYQLGREYAHDFRNQPFRKLFEEDQEKASDYFQRAAALGHRGAQSRLRSPVPSSPRLLQRSVEEVGLAALEMAAATSDSLRNAASTVKRTLSDLASSSASLLHAQNLSQ